MIKELSIFSDGGTVGNHDINVDTLYGWAFRVVAKSDKGVFSMYDTSGAGQGKVTNSRAEAVAFSNAVEYVYSLFLNGNLDKTHIIFRGDSEYIIKTFIPGVDKASLAADERRIDKWIKQNWVHKTGPNGERAHRDLLEKSYERIQEMEKKNKIEFMHVNAIHEHLGEVPKDWNEKMQAKVDTHLNIARDGLYELQQNGQVL